ncbi:glycine C-acetyltransferase [Candidatus Gottesmanbacteria bacterium]|nr:glycine C-acetyltransferase [Candidatus Gottesmanbacteria bacterium]
MKLTYFSETIREMKEKGLFNNIRTVESGQGAWLKVNGKKVLNLCSNNYLGLASDSRLTAAVLKAVRKFGVGTASVRSLSGTNVLHLELEERLADFKKAESSIALTGGYMANLAAIQTILDKEDIVISDELNHASIIDAIRIAGIRNKFIYQHKNMNSLEEKLQQAKEVQKTKKEDVGSRKILIVTDGVFSMDGDLAPLPDIVKLALRYSAFTMVDDAHGEGVLGSHGRGIADHFHLHGKIDIEVGTLSKAFGVMGGFITGKKELIEFYRQKARQFLFSNGLSIPDTAALIEAVKILKRSDKLVKKLRENANYLKKGFKKHGFDIGNSETPITPVMLGSENLAKNFSATLFEEGVYATPIKYPMVPLGKARIRVMPSAIHSKKDLDFGLSVFERVGKKLNVLS